MLYQQGSKKTDCVCFAPWMKGPMYKYRAKKWCPKDLRPPKTSMRKAKRVFPSFADVGQRCKREKSPFGVCAASSQKAMTPDLPISATSLHNKPSSLSVWGLSHPHGGKTHQSSTMPWGYFKNVELIFDSLDSPETLWERLQQGVQLWRTSIKRNRLLKRGLQCTFDAKDHSVGRKREPITSVMAYSPQKMLRKRNIPAGRW